eukprot:6197710-Pleurochrysis_carterae.AAC.1
MCTVATSIALVLCASLPVSLSTRKRGGTQSLVGLVIGPRGTTQQLLQSESGCTVVVRGKVRDGPRENGDERAARGCRSSRTRVRVRTRACVNLACA